MKSRSLSMRLLAAVGILLIVFFGATIAAIDLVYRNLAESFIRARLDLHVSNLIAASDESADQTLVPNQKLLNPGFNALGSGLFAQIQRNDGAVMWWSPSLTDTQLTLFANAPVGQRLTRRMHLPDGSEVQALSVGLQWEFPDGRPEHFTYTAAEDLAPYRTELSNIREQLLVWFGGLLLLLLLALAVVFRWVMKPVRLVEREIADIEAGRAGEFSGRYPRELLGITASMNALLKSERDRQARYRNTLGNLAHSLKTPLTVLKSAVDTPQLHEQVARMDEIVTYQLKRAAMVGGTGLGHSPVEVRPVIEALRDALLKVYADKALSLLVQVDAATHYFGDRGDLMEIAGNLLDNACKWARARVRIGATPMAGGRRDGLRLIVEDDGPGIAPEQREHVLRRGARLDERVSGQGIGLSVVNEIAQLSGGDVEIDASELGGAKITVRLPAL